MARAASIFAVVIAIVALASNAQAFQCPTLALQAAPLQAACANATTVCTQCVAALAVQLEPALHSLLTQGVALLNASMVRRTRD